ncbi:protease-associated PA domain protein [Anaeromyxobacter sp. K]|nr:protease-associated PA domain protein [Anaeromyxobacter sp. K]
MRDAVGPGRRVRAAVGCALLLLVAAPVGAAAAPGARVYRGGPGGALTPPSRAPATDVVAGFLRSHGATRAAVDGLAVAAESRGRGGITHLRLEQRAGGLRVAGAYARAAVDASGRLIHLVDVLAPVAGGGVAPARVTAAQALEAALRRLGYLPATAPAATGRDGELTVFARDAARFHAAPTVERVAIPEAGGALRAGFLVETWSERGNLLHHTLVAGDGAIRSVELRTANDSYAVFVEDPSKTPQAVVSGPAPGGAESPVGWLYPGTQSTIDIAGNNVNAYLDADANNRPDRGGTAVTDGNFLTAADLTAQPSTSGNRAVAVQNLFYLNNVIHDVLYVHGFDEAAGNFQDSNFGRGGKERDSVNAEAQDGGGTDNANFATPTDGRSPRMQMYLWNGPVPPLEVVVNAPAGIAGSYDAAGAEFGPSLTTAGVTGDVLLVDDGTGTATDGCEAVQNAVSGRIALVDRGGCNFTVKVLNAQAAGAVAVIVANNQGGDAIFTMGGTERKIRIPAVMISQNDGATLKGATGVNATARRKDPAPLMVDGDLDSDVVFHEYGHGLTWRMIGGMSGPLAGAVGEGMSDVLAVVMNEDDRVGEYAASNPLGIRTAPYTGYPRTYGDVAGTEVHLDGEVYGAIGWRLFQSFQTAGLGKSLLLDYLVDGMNYTPSTPAFEDMRDGILQAVSAAASPDAAAHACLVWDAFAAYGVGVGALGTVDASGAVTVTESFAKPAGCP